jgi:hypothetical protein
MKQIEVRLPHQLSEAEVRRRIDAAVAKARDEYSEQVRDLTATWATENRLDLGLTVMGMEIEAAIDNLPAELVVRVGVPGMAALFAGRIQAGIEERLGGLLGVQPA